MLVQHQSAAAASGAELVAELAQRFVCRRGHESGLDLHRDGELAVPQDVHGHARVDVEGGQRGPHDLRRSLAVDALRPTRAAFQRFAEFTFPPRWLFRANPSRLEQQKAP
jgi:hypothetical protein